MSLSFLKLAFPHSKQWHWSKPHGDLTGSEAANCTRISVYRLLFPLLKLHKVSGQDASFPTTYRLTPTLAESDSMDGPAIAPLRALLFYIYVKISSSSLEARLPLLSKCPQRFQSILCRQNHLIGLIFALLSLLPSIDSLHRGSDSHGSTFTDGRCHVDCLVKDLLPCNASVS